MNYSFSTYIFSEQEIEQIVVLTKQWANGSCLPVDARKFSKQVRMWACHWSLLVKREDNRLYFTSGNLFDPRYYLPVEALWRLVSPMLRQDGITGYSIVNNPQWKHLNIYTQNSRFATERDLQEKEDILLELSTHHYINFQMAGDVWSIYVERK